MPDGSDLNNRFNIIISYVPAHWLNLDMDAGSNIEFIAQNLRVDSGPNLPLIPEITCR